MNVGSVAAVTAVRSRLMKAVCFANFESRDLLTSKRSTQGVSSLGG